MHVKPRSLFITAFLLIVFSVTISFKSDRPDFASARETIIMRTIGHKILLSSGDSSSIVLPVDKTADNQYTIRFGNALQFMPDSIVRIVREAAATNHLPVDYVVNVLDCKKNQVVFGFAILQTEQNNLVPCKGRVQPKGCYYITIRFRDNTVSTLNNKYLVAAGGGLTALLLIFSGIKISNRQKKTTVNREETPSVTPGMIPIGNYQFHSAKQYLAYGDKQIELSDKESKILSILAGKLNELVERGELQKIWEDEGVIVGRSLDMFISKLRKKLEDDPTVRLANIHGKGYKLEII